MTDGLCDVVTAEPRRISLPLMTGLIAAPSFFVWLMLRRGYARSTRTAAFTYAAILFGFGLVGRLR
ncbi:MAG: hypothetical protein JWM65_2419 [Sphingomonas bacterium]|jgi:hypothetical protein|nr:hypothetical protein [Sphingomonas bacterium]